MRIKLFAGWKYCAGKEIYLMIKSGQNSLGFCFGVGPLGLIFFPQNFKFSLWMKFFKFSFASSSFLFTTSSLSEEVSGE